MVSSSVNTDGTLLVVVGPSGVGKDSLINALRDRLRDESSVHFVQRTITRPADSGGEPHLAATPEEFETLEKQGAFAVCWQAHGLSYGIPVSAVHAYEAGKAVIVNGSRAALPLVAERFANTVVINVTADPEVIAKRLAARGREDAEQIAQRLKRGTEVNFNCDVPVVTIDNSGELSAAVDAFLDHLGTISAQSAKTA